MSYQTVAGHRSMALDHVRNAAYEAALQRVVTPESVVLDLGAGTGVLGLMAARLGARRVYLVEPADILFVAEEIVRANGLEDVVRCLHGRLEDVRVPEPVDVIVSVLTGNFLLTEDLLQTLLAARSQVLKPGGVLIPGAASMEAVPVSAPALFEREVAAWSVAEHGVDLSGARSYAANTIFYRGEELREARWLAEPAVLRTVDFHRDDDVSVHTEAVFEVIESGMCHGWAGWFSMQLGESWLSTSPQAAPVHWRAAFMPVDPPVALEKGECAAFVLDRSPLGDWSWRVRAGSVLRQHSTLLSAPLSPDTLRRSAREYRPSLRADGQMHLEVLARCDGTASVDELAGEMLARYPGRLRTHAEALRFIQRIVRHHA